MQFIKGLFRMILFGLVLMVMRSPLAMFLTGIMIGLFFYHYYPSNAQSGVSYVQEAAGSVVDKFYSIPLQSLVPEDRGSYEREQPSRDAFQ